MRAMMPGQFPPFKLFHKGLNNPQDPGVHATAFIEGNDEANLYKYRVAG
jgi:hypothetical protein